MIINPQIQLTSNHEKIVYEEAAVLAREKYKGSVPFALSALYGKLRNSGDSVSAAIAYELLQRMEDEVYDSLEQEQEIEREEAE